MRCTLQLSPRGIFVDGERVSRADAVAYCKGTAGATVVLEANPTQVWDATARALVVVEDKATKAEWDETRSALQREAVRFYVRGPLCYDPRTLGCRPRAAPESGHEAERKVEPEPRVHATQPLAAPPASEPALTGPPPSR